MTSQETNEDIMKSFENKDSSSPTDTSGSLTPRVTPVQFADSETDAFSKLAEERAYFKKTIDLTTPDQQAEYFNKTSSMKDASILLNDDDIDDPI